MWVCGLCGVRFPGRGRSIVAPCGLHPICADAVGWLSGWFRCAIAWHTMRDGWGWYSRRHGMRCRRFLPEGVWTVLWIWASCDSRGCGICMRGFPRPGCRTQVHRQSIVTMLCRELLLSFYFLWYCWLPYQFFVILHPLLLWHFLPRRMEMPCGCVACGGSRRVQSPVVAAWTCHCCAEA